MIIFIFFFSAFLAIAINYAQAFQTKNRIINAIEQAEGYNVTSRTTIAEIKSSSGYFREIDDEQCRNKLGDTAFVARNSGQNGAGTEELEGICIRENQSDNGSYYTVQTYVWFNFPIIGDIATIPVTGETKLIVNNVIER